LSVGHSVVSLAGNAVLRTENRDKFDVRSLIKKVDGPISLAIDAAVVGYESNTSTAQRPNLVSLKDVDAGQNLVSLSVSNRGLSISSGRILGDLRLRLWKRRRHDAAGYDRRHLTAKPIDVAFRLWMHSITQEDDGRFAARIDPNTRPGETRVPK